MLEVLGAWRARPELLAGFMPVLAGQISGPSVEEAYARLKKNAPLAKRLYHTLSCTKVDEMVDFIAGMPDDGIRQAWLVERVQ